MIFFEKINFFLSKQENMKNSALSLGNKGKAHFRSCH